MEANKAAQHVAYRHRYKVYKYKHNDYWVVVEKYSRDLSSSVVGADRHRQDGQTVQQQTVDAVCGSGH